MSPSSFQHPSLVSLYSTLPHFTTGGPFRIGVVTLGVVRGEVMICKVVLGVLGVLGVIFEVTFNVTLGVV